VAYYPGTGLPARYDRHFFMCDFRGGPNSVVRSFALRPKGASFEAFDETEFLTGPLCTDVDFGVDGAVYVSDWVQGWDKTDKGRIYRVFDPNTVNDPAVREVKKLLGERMEMRSTEELARLLGHQDMRVRLEAQWELVRRVDSASINREAAEEAKAFERLSEAQLARGASDNILNKMPLTPFRALRMKLEQTNDPITQIHSLWGIQQIGTRSWKQPLLLSEITSQADLRQRMPDNAFMPIVALGRATWERNSSPVRAAAFRALSRSTRFSSGRTAVTNRDPTVQAAALATLGRQAAVRWPEVPARYRSDTLGTIAAALRIGENDAHIRHAAVLALARIGDVPALRALARDDAPAVRLGVCLAFRRLQRPEIAQFLRDSDPQIVLEAARAIHDAPIPDAMNALASVPLPSRRDSKQEPGRMPGALSRQEPALARRVLNAHFRLGAETNAQALAEFAASEASDALRAEALELLALWARPPGRDRVVGLWRPLAKRDGTIAAKAFQAVLPQIDASAPAVVKLAAKKTLTELAVQPGEAAANPDSAAQLTRLSTALENGSLTEKQSALMDLSEIDNAAAAKLLGAWLDKLVAGDVAKELRLDVMEAVTRSRLASSASTAEKLARIEADRDAKDLLAKWRDCLYGGDAAEGKRTFVERQDAACFRCHKINGEGGEVGPEMAGLGARMTREAILESILLPNKAIAPGFENVLVALKDGTTYAGLLKSESDSELTINSPEDGLITVRKADVQARDRGLSSMPEELGTILSKRDVRNLVEFLSTLK
jgi:quinoprotein glucose dehydrogenase